MMFKLLFLLLPVAAYSGWLIGNKNRNRVINKRFTTLRHDYFIGLNYLLNEQTDKAVDVFIKMLEVDSDTVETHLALGHLFRQRGEVNRAIRIHQNLIARPQLPKEQRIQALFELGKDYMNAGVLDRAERLFLELVAMNEFTESSLNYLLDIYQQQKDWEQAIQIAKKIAHSSNKDMHETIAHHYCELTQTMKAEGQFNKAQNYLKQALTINKNCARASLIQANMEMERGQYQSAIRYLKRVERQDPEYITEIIEPLSACYEALGDEKELFSYLQSCLQNHPRISVALALSEHLRKWQGEKVAIDFIAEQIRHYPSLRGFGRLITLYLHKAAGDVKEKLIILLDLVNRLLIDKPVYRCNHCGFSGKTIYWLCPGCKSWNTIKPIHGLEGD